MHGTSVSLGERGRVEELLTRFGRDPLSFCVRYDAPWQYVFGEAAEGAVAYLEHRGVAVV